MIPAVRSDSGFTLIEILLAIGILMVGSLGAMGVFVIASDSHRLAVDQTEAALAAEALIADYQRMCTRENINELPWELTDGELHWQLTDQQCADFPQFYYDLTLEVLDPRDGPESLDEATELLATLTLKHNKGDDPKAYTFQTVFLVRPF